MLRLKLLPPLSRIVGEKDILVDLDRAPLRLVLERAVAQNPNFRSAMLDRSGRLSHDYSCLVNGQRYNVSDPGDVEVDGTDEVTLLLPLAGGS